MIDTSSEEFQQRVGLKIWAERENLKRFAHNYTLMRNAGYHSVEDIKEAIDISIDEFLHSQRTVRDIESEMDNISSIIADSEKYLELKKYNDKYEKAKEKESVLQKYESEIILFTGAKNALKKQGVKLKDIDAEFVEKQRKLYYDLQHEKDKANEVLSSKKDKTGELKELYEKLKKELTIEELHQKEKVRKKNKNVAL